MRQREEKVWDWTRECHPLSYPMANPPFCGKDPIREEGKRLGERESPLLLFAPWENEGRRTRRGTTDCRKRKEEEGRKEFTKMILSLIGIFCFLDILQFRRINKQRMRFSFAAFGCF